MVGGEQTIFICVPYPNVPRKIILQKYMFCPLISSTKKNLNVDRFQHLAKDLHSLDCFPDKMRKNTV